MCQIQHQIHFVHLNILTSSSVCVCVSVCLLRDVLILFMLLFAMKKYFIFYGCLLVCDSYMLNGTTFVSDSRVGQVRMRSLQGPLQTHTQSLIIRIMRQNTERTTPFCFKIIFAVTLPTFSFPLPHVVQCINIIALLHISSQFFQNLCWTQQPN